jgi:hypothetical protein
VVLPARGDVQRKSFLLDQLADRYGAKRFARVYDFEVVGSLSERVQVPPALVPDGLFFVNEQRRAERTGKIDDVATVDVQMAKSVVRGGYW